MKMCEESKSVANAWCIHADTHRLNPINLKTYRRAQRDFLAGVMAGYEAMCETPPPFLTNLLVTNGDLLAQAQPTQEEA